MKLKTITLLAVSGLMAASLAYVAPAFADDNYEMAANEIDGAPVQLAMADDAGGDSAGTADNSGSTGTGDSRSGSSDSSGASSNNSGASNTGAANGSDQGTPDVASGDDDY